MATTVHAGPTLGAALQSASNTAGTARKADAERDENARRQSLAEADIRRVSAISDGIELENQLLEQGRQEALEAARVENVLFKQSLKPTGAVDELDELGESQFAELFEGSTPEQKGQLRDLLRVGRSHRAEVEGMQDLFKDLVEFQVDMTDATSAPQGMQEQSQELLDAIIRTKPLEDPGRLQEFQSAFQQMREERLAHRSRKRFQEGAISKFRATFGDDPELAFAESMIAEDPSLWDDAVEVGMQHKFPTSYEAMLTKERERNRTDLTKSIMGAAAGLAEKGEMGLDEALDMLWKSAAANSGDPGLQQISEMTSPEPNGETRARIQKRVEQLKAEGKSREEIRAEIEQELGKRGK